MNKNVLKEIVDEIIGSANELLEMDNRDLVQEGELIAYAESLSIIRDACAGYDLSEIGLDFDIDSKYLR